MNVQPWMLPILVGVVTVSGFGNYSALSVGNEHLVQLQAEVSETNRLAEMRGAVQSDLRTLFNEVDKLRSIIHDKQNISVANDNFRLIKEILTTHKATLERKADIALVEKVIDSLNTFATHEQINVLIGRVDAISRRISNIESNKQ